MAWVLRCWFIIDWLICLTMLGKAHYCYYCASSITHDNSFGSFLFQQRIFVYPWDAARSHCQIGTGQVQICHRPICLSITPHSSLINTSTTRNKSNFVVHGCAEMILRPSMIRRIPSDLQLEQNGGRVCLDFDGNIGSGAKFTLCFCQLNWCNMEEKNTTELANSNSTPTPYTTRKAPTPVSTNRKIGPASVYIPNWTYFPRQTASVTRSPLGGSVRPSTVGTVTNSLYQKTTILPTTVHPTRPISPAFRPVHPMVKFFFPTEPSFRLRHNSDLRSKSSAISSPSSTPSTTSCNCAQSYFLYLRANITRDSESGPSNKNGKSIPSGRTYSPNKLTSKLSKIPVPTTLTPQIGTLVRLSPVRLVDHANRTEPRLPEQEQVKMNETDPIYFNRTGIGENGSTTSTEFIWETLENNTTKDNKSTQVTLQQIPLPWNINDPPFDCFQYRKTSNNIGSTSFPLSISFIYLFSISFLYSVSVYS